MRNDVLIPVAFNPSPTLPFSHPSIPQHPNILQLQFGTKMIYQKNHSTKKSQITATQIELTGIQGGKLTLGTLSAKGKV